MSRIEFRAMGTTVEAWLEGDEETVVEWFDVVERACSRFLSTSELSAINRAAPATVPVSDLMADILTLAMEVRDSTSGLVDIGVGGAVADWGYDRTFDEVTALGEEPLPRPDPGWDFRDGAVTLERGTRLDLGGVAKGWACDRGVDRGLADVISAGGDMRSADAGTIARVEDPWGRVVASVPVGRGGLATSSVGRRRWLVAGREVSHLIHPATMRPIDSPVLSATALASTAVEAEAAAKAVLLQGPDGLAWADRQPWVRGALVVWHDGAVYGTVGLELVA